MTKSQLIDLLARFPEDAEIAFWPFREPCNATKAHVGLYQPREVCEGHIFPAKIILELTA